MNDSESVTEMSREMSKSEKTPYAEPELIVHGTLVELTKFLTQGASDGVTGTAP